ncbi:cell envelope integrity protein CreD [Shewanella sp. OPT22]|nr:cell envelope integrity protein CreD [Shewanella sp. OPT22]
MKNILNNQLGTKFGFVLLLFILLQIPVSMVSNLIDERSHRLNDVRNDIGKSSSGEQNIVGPFIIVDYTEMSVHDDKMFRKDGKKIILPNTFEMKGELNSFEKYRGIYHAQLFKAQTSLKGSFDLRRIEDLREHQINNVSLIVGVKDSRGLIRFDEMKLDGTSVEFSPGTSINQIPQGFHHELALESLTLDKPLNFDLNFLLQGMGKLQVTPIGNRSTVELASEWPHPSFIGNYLPVTSNVSETGFSAQWSSNNFSTNIAQLFSRCFTSNDTCYELSDRQMGVDLIAPVDHYLKSHRAVNYSLLVITLVFASFFLLELFQARPVHPVQYGFVGLALALFYLLLISLSEHIGFNWAYVVSAIASTALLSVYVSGVLQQSKHGVVFGLSLFVLYGMLFGLLQAESYALLMGTVLCFVILSLVMLLTRHIDWYERNEKNVEKLDEVTREVKDAWTP